MNQYGYDEYDEFNRYSQNQKTNTQPQQSIQQQVPRKQLQANGTAPASNYQSRFKHSGVGHGSQHVKTAADIEREIMQSTENKLANNSVIQNNDKTQKALNDDNGAMQAKMQQAMMVAEEARKDAEKKDLIRHRVSKEFLHTQEQVLKNSHGRYMSEEEKAKNKANKFGFSGISDNQTTFDAETTTHTQDDAEDNIQVENTEVTIQPEVFETEIDESDFSEQSIVVEPTKETVETASVNPVLKHYDGTNGAELSQAYAFHIESDEINRDDIISHFTKQTKDILGYICDEEGIADIDTKTQQLYVVPSENGIMIGYVAPKPIYDTMEPEMRTKFLDSVKDVLNSQLTDIHMEAACSNAQAMTYDEFISCETAAREQKEKFKDSLIPIAQSNPNPEPQVLMELMDNEANKNNEPVFC